VDRASLPDRLAALIKMLAFSWSPAFRRYSPSCLKAGLQQGGNWRAPIGQGCPIHESGFGKKCQRTPSACFGGTERSPRSRINVEEAGFRFHTSAQPITASRSLPARVAKPSSLLRPEADRTRRTFAPGRRAQLKSAFSPAGHFRS
jgi:hypothetical protein